MKITDKQIKLLELFTKALANKNRIKVLLLIKEKPKLNVEEISDILKMNYPNGAVHILRLEKVGFIYKRVCVLRVEDINNKTADYFLFSLEKSLNLE